MSLRFAIIHCHHCGKQHVDQGAYAARNHSRHLCEHCGRFFYTKPGNIGVTSTGTVQIALTR